MRNVLLVVALTVVLLLTLGGPAFGFELEHPVTGACKKIIDPADVGHPVAPWNGHFNANGNAPLTHGAC